MTTRTSVREAPVWSAVNEHPNIWTSEQLNIRAHTWNVNDVIFVQYSDHIDQIDVHHTYHWRCCQRVHYHQTITSTYVDILYNNVIYFVNQNGTITHLQIGWWWLWWCCQMSHCGHWAFLCNQDFTRQNFVPVQFLMDMLANFVPTCPFSIVTFPNTNSVINNELGCDISNEDNVMDADYHTNHHHHHVQTFVVINTIDRAKSVQFICLIPLIFTAPKNQLKSQKKSKHTCCLYVYSTCIASHVNQRQVIYINPWNCNICGLQCNHRPSMCVTDISQLI